MKKKTIVIVGLGLIGGSMAFALRQNGGYTLLGVDTDPAVLAAAQQRGAVHRTGGPELAGEADIVILALSPGTALTWLEQHAGQVKKGAIVTDVCGVKQAIVPRASELCRAAGLYFVGGHPMAGKEKSGFDHADGALFAGASYILTPADDTPSFAVEELKALAAALGCARMTMTTPGRHDRLIAFTSQLPHALAGAYVRSPCCPYHAGFSAGSYRDVSRVATVDENLWSELFMLNSTALCAELDLLIAHLRDCRDAVAAGNRDGLRALLREGRQRKEEAG